MLLANLGFTEFVYINISFSKTHLHFSLCPVGPPFCLHFGSSLPIRCMPSIGSSPLWVARVSQEDAPSTGPHPSGSVSHRVSTPQPVPIASTSSIPVHCPVLSGTQGPAASHFWSHPPAIVLVLLGPATPAPDPYLCLDLALPRSSFSSCFSLGSHGMLYLLCLSFLKTLFLFKVNIFKF